MPEQKPTNSAEDTASNPNPEANSDAAEDAAEDYAGYANLDEMRKAVYESRKEGARLAARERQLAEQNVQLAAALAARTNPGASRTDLDEIADLGIPVEALRGAMKQIAREVVGSELAPVTATQTAISAVRATHPTFAKQESDFNRWLSANADVAAAYNQAVTESPRSAERLLRGVYAEYELTRRAPAAPDPTKKVSSDAKIAAGRGAPTGGARKESEGARPSQEQIRELIREARVTGDKTKLMRVMLGDRPIHRDLTPKD